MRNLNPVAGCTPAAAPRTGGGEHCPGLLTVYASRCTEVTVGMRNLNPVVGCTLAAAPRTGGWEHQPPDGMRNFNPGAYASGGGTPSGNQEIRIVYASRCT